MESINGSLNAIGQRSAILTVAPGASLEIVLVNVGGHAWRVDVEQIVGFGSAAALVKSYSADTVTLFNPSADTIHYRLSCGAVAGGDTIGYAAYAHASFGNAIPGAPVVEILNDRGLSDPRWVATGGALVPASVANPYGDASTAAVFTEDASNGPHGVAIPFNVVKGRRYRVMIELGNPGLLPAPLRGLVGISGPVFRQPSTSEYLGSGVSILPSDGTFTTEISSGYNITGYTGTEWVTIAPTYGRVSFDVIANANGVGSFDIYSTLGDDPFTVAGDYAYAGDGASTLTLYNARILEIQDY